MTARILVADGVATTRIRLKVRLAAACYDVITVETPERLRMRALADRPDLIVLGEGFAAPGPIEICKRLQGDRDLAAIPVLMLAGAAGRLDALRAGAAAVLSVDVDEQMLLARIRGLLRDAESDIELQSALAEAPTAFVAPSARIEIALVADSPARALRWRHLLRDRLSCRFSIHNPEEALAAAASGRAAALYLIAADIEGRGDGLRLMSELRSRSGSRDSAFVIATTPERDELSAVALDLGAGDVLPIDLGGGGGIESTVLALQAQLSRKKQGDRRRAELRRNMMWAMTDPLTGLHNRRYALPRLAETVGNARRDRLPFAVLLLDLDRFKRVNDLHGHAAGDAVLREVARRLETVIGPQGIAARLGGEEFLAILPGADEAAAYRCAEDLRRAVEAQPIPLPDLSGGGSVHVTLSVGVATGRPCQEGLRPDQLAEWSLERADRALMLAKSHGRNRVMLAQTEHAA
ncbi:diguanylate cyclase [Paracoccus marinaquae]|uniref:diguanylate cyclase n=1 Tax=Paracoccus marinaquae TaxID=2841926 RepID=A0ABS6AFD0_9RHOB|nr:diguanylate cyclase [Paracoccus marinaquae]MBU3029311.1 diguanylate cyclase [Paracoccus marinaquae]